MPNVISMLKAGLTILFYEEIHSQKFQMSFPCLFAWPVKCSLPAAKEAGCIAAPNKISILLAKRIEKAPKV